MYRLEIRLKYRCFNFVGSRPRLPNCFERLVLCCHCSECGAAWLRTRERADPQAVAPTSRPNFVDYIGFKCLLQLSGARAVLALHISHPQFCRIGAFG